MLKKLLFLFENCTKQREREIPKHFFPIERKEAKNLKKYKTKKCIHLLLPSIFASPFSNQFYNANGLMVYTKTKNESFFSIGRLIIRVVDSLDTRTCCGIIFANCQVFFVQNHVLNNTSLWLKEGLSLFSSTLVYIHRSKMQSDFLVIHETLKMFIYTKWNTHIKKVYFKRPQPKNTSLLRDLETKKTYSFFLLVFFIDGNFLFKIIWTIFGTFFLANTAEYSF